MRLIRFLWKALNNLVRLVQIIILLAIVAIILASLTDRGIEMPDSAALVVAPSGALVEQLEGDPLERAFAEAGGGRVRQTLVHDITESLQLAADDERIKGVVLMLDEMEDAGLAKLQEVGESIEVVRAAGKPVIAVGDSYSQAQYYLAAHADEIYLHDLGVVLIDGFDYYRAFLRDALDKFKVDMNVFRVGKYKSFIEPFTRNDMSDEDRQASERWLGTLWSNYTRDVEAARGLDDGAIEAFANLFLEKLAATQGNTAQMALDAGLVDVLGDRRAFIERAIEIAGPSEADDERFSGIDVGSYLAVMRSDRLLERKDAKIGVLVASGEIVDGEAPRGVVGGDTLAGLVDRVADDESIKALVLRVDSPGGSMFASEVVFAELQRLKLAGKPLIVSMSSTAASGGYYISMPADEIWAGESTITGSIGVGAFVPTFQKALGSVGVTIDGFGTTSLAGQLRLDRELGDEARQILQLGVEEAYRVFVDKVATSRDMSAERTENLARGRVWIGSDALELGLVDRLGSLNDAIASAA
ncbi:MAG: signal peptide peptidase SppA, partial [Gammaproteobacteria bacterium]